MKLKGIVIAIIISLASIMMPFSVYAAVQSQIVPTFSSSTSQWNGHLYVTNFSDGTDNQASSTLSFTLDDDYYGIIYFDGYGPSNQHIANYAACFVAGGYGEYRYSYYQNGVINITQVTINIVNVVKPDSSVDLTQIIQLLTAIENDTTSIDNLLDSTLSSIRSILSQLIISNGYLDTLTQLRQWHFPIESFSFNYYLMQNRQYQIIDIANLNYYDYPVYQVPANGQIEERYINNGQYYIFIFGTDLPINDISNLSTYFDISIGSFSEFELINATAGFRFIKFKVINMGSGVFTISVKNQSKIVGILSMRSDYFDKQLFSLDFALNWGLKNNLLNNLDIIANGTNQSNSAASDLESSNSQMADDMDDLATIESGYNQQFNNQLQSIDFTSPIQNNAGILPAANFVISIFNGLINNNPFSVLIIVVCILLIGKKVIGK